MLFEKEKREKTNKQSAQLTSVNFYKYQFKQCIYLSIYLSIELYEERKEWKEVFVFWDSLLTLLELSLFLLYLCLFSLCLSLSSLIILLKMQSTMIPKVWNSVYSLIKKGGAIALLMYPTLFLFWDRSVIFILMNPLMLFIWKNRVHIAQLTYSSLHSSAATGESLRFLSSTLFLGRGDPHPICAPWCGWSHSPFLLYLYFDI